MIAVIFEVWPTEDRTREYFDWAAELRAELEKIDGFISIERFESMATKGKYLSISFWRDETAILQWRNLEKHRQVQQEGRRGIFSDYRIRVATVVRDYGMHQRSDTPQDSLAAHE